MVEGMLTQEEIDALLSGAAFDGGGSTAPAAKPVSAGPAPAAVPMPMARPAGGGGGELSAGELKALGERLKTGMASAADVTATLIGRSLSLSPVSINGEDDAGLSTLVAQDSVVFDCVMKGAVSGPAALVISRREVAAIASILMGGEAAASAELDDIHISAAQEGIKHFAGGLAGALTREMGSEVRIDDVMVRTDLASVPPLAGHPRKVAALYELKIDNQFTGTLLLVMDPGLSRTLSGSRTVAETPRSTGASMGGGRGVNVQPVAFPNLTPSLSDGQAKNIEILMDVPMQITVELGRATKMIRDILELGTGSIIELEKLAGEPVDLRVNQTLIARGEVVVIDENFGVRVTDIVSPIERLKGMA